MTGQIPRDSRLRAASAWDQQWSLVPLDWRTGTYRIDTAPANEVFTQNVNYAPGRRFDFRPGGPDRLGDELAWWVYVCWAEGLRKIEPSMLRWWSDAVTSLAEGRQAVRQPVSSLAELHPYVVVKEAHRLFNARNARLPSVGNRRNLASIAEHVHLLVGARTGEAPWWSANTWSLLADPRIPRREHEPAGDKTVRIGQVDPLWLREGLRFYLSRTLTHDVFTWTTVTTRSRTLSAHLGSYLTSRAVSSPELAADVTELRALMTDYLDWLRSPAATATGKPLQVNSVASAQSAVQTFYEFMYDHAEEAAAFTSDQRWLQLGTRHTRLWAPSHQVRGRNHRAAPDSAKFITAQDLSAMAACVPILAASATQKITVDLPGGGNITTHGLGDPQAANAWLIQAATGRRASEVLMLSYRCLSSVPGAPTGEENAFVARLRYQQTKSQGIDPTILIEQYVVDLIHAQQAWTRAHLGLSEDDPDPPYLFISPRQNLRGIRPRSYTAHARVLTRLDQITSLKDEHGNPLRFTSTHRLRHSRATALLNAGVPVHVVQDYLGHRSPEMTMHYARTLAKTAEAEFLKASSSGAYGAPLALSQRDAYQIAQLAGRADRALPNGTCLLPPTQNCDKGNACLTCTSFATDSTHLPALRRQRTQTLELITDRQRLVTERRGEPLPANNVWLQARNRELTSLDQIVTALSESPDDPVKGAGAGARRPVDESGGEVE